MPRCLCRWTSPSRSSVCHLVSRASCSRSDPRPLRTAPRFEGVTVLFLAQVYGLDLSLGQQVRVMLMSVVAGIGTAGVPGGSLPMVMIVAQSVGVPAEGMALILGVDRFLDMCRTAVNVSGDLVIAALVGRTANEEER